MDISKKSVDAIRIPSADEISCAGTGHPGICFGAAPVMYAHAMKYDCAHPSWENRDRFVLSAGHGSAMLCAALHLFGLSAPREALFARFGFTSENVADKALRSIERSKADKSDRSG